MGRIPRKRRCRSEFRVRVQGWRSPQWALITHSPSHGLSTPAAQVAMIAKRYMHLSGATSRDFGAISVADRKHAAKNPKAYF